MKTNAGLIELDCGWILAVAAVAPDQVRMVLQFDPHKEMLAHGVKDLRLTGVEAAELVEALGEALVRAQGRTC